MSFCGATEDDTGSDHVGRILCFLRVVLKEPMKWNYLVGFDLMAGGVFVIFKEW